MENTQNNQATIRKIMEKESASKILNDIKNKIGGVDLMDICEDETEVSKLDLDDDNKALLIRAIMCGLVYWDEGKNCLIQKLINPIQSGELTASEFAYKNRIVMDDLKSINLQNPIELLEKTLAQVVARPIQLIGKLYGQDLGIATACISFFGK